MNFNLRMSGYFFIFVYGKNNRKELSLYLQNYKQY